MRKIGALGVALVLLISGLGLLGASIGGDKPETKDMRGNPTKYITGTGFNDYGYNYIAHIFSGWYHNVAASKAGDPPWTYETLVAAGKTTTWLIMKWNDAWLSNQDSDGDGYLDRPSDNGGTYIGSGAWCTNHQSGSYIEDGEEYKWSYFVKMVSAPSDAYTEDGYWYEADGTQIGTVIWGQHARIEQIYNDQGTGEHGVENNWDAPTGFGYYQ